VTGQQQQQCHQGLLQWAAVAWGRDNAVLEATLAPAELAAPVRQTAHAQHRQALHNTVSHAAQINFIWKALVELEFMTQARDVCSELGKQPAASQL
jgi:hypothetical protein